ncbi:Uncharacterised protein g3247 [Pycnogonum litorale]
MYYIRVGFLTIFLRSVVVFCDSFDLNNSSFVDKGSVLIRQTGVAGFKVSLPCNITPPSPEDIMVVVLWYKDTIESPIYWIDTRKGNATSPKHFVEDVYKKRLYFETNNSPALLKIKKILEDDAGVYRCRVDFDKSRTINSKVELQVIVPPGKPTITDDSGDVLLSHIGPYNEAKSLILTCKTEGGKPLPSLTWWKGTQLMKSTTVSSPDGVVQSIFTITKLKRKHLNAALTCQASNNNLTVPPSSTVILDVNLTPMTAAIISKRKQLSAGKQIKIVCESTGSRPPAIITWWKGNKKMKSAEETVSGEKNKTTSVLTFIPVSRDDGKYLSCRADNPNVPRSAKEDGWKLQVQYAPELKVQLGSNRFSGALQEFHDVYFKCSVRANPTATKIQWLFEGRILENNKTAGIIVAGDSLVLQKVKRRQRGGYTCSTANSQGTGTSNTFELKVKHPPVCKAFQRERYGVSLHETVNVVCEVDADPSDVKFEWTFNNSIETMDVINFFSEKTASTAKYTPRQKSDYGILSCLGSNAAGRQLKPCQFRISFAGPPEPLYNCSIVNQTLDSIQVFCSEGYHGGLPQVFTMEVYDKLSNSLQANITNKEAPSFLTTGLSSNRNYTLKIYATNAKGRSSVESIYVTISEPAQMQTVSVLVPEAKTKKPKPYHFSPILGILIGVVASLVTIALIIVIIMRILNTRNYHETVDKSEKT